ncbi:DNA repair protein RecN (Recombination protein N) [Geomicrobium halophilum]|uniref:DNA repair protein RecN n=1 Tax=Geomicrobium halophilum TaxID=549000 RepID=A0A841PP14_9BACL|nr:DNA repair protein RecN [Geomicrobium halophilum]MBB6448936.1 DNA repair protein RecN (Recombination protein N) [Geomicrobium halophilum]
MLEELTIRNFAIIEELTVPFTSGLTVLTGETGAGKSMIIDALGLLAGGRGSADFVRHESKKAEIEGLFTVPDDHLASERMAASGIDGEEEGMIILRREITHKGKSICRINGQLVTLTTLRSIGQTLVDIHGQHEHQELLQMDKHSGMVDTYAASTLFSLKADYEHHFDQYMSIKNELQRLRNSDRENMQRLDLIQYQLGEIENAALHDPNEDRELEQERYKLAHAEKLYELLQYAYTNLYDEGKGLEWLRSSVNHLEDAAIIDPALKNTSEQVASSFYTIEESSYAIREHIDQLDFDSGRLEHVESRLSEIEQLKRKYGSSISEILNFAEDISQEQETLLHRDENIRQYELRLDEMAGHLFKAADTLTAERKKAAEALAIDVEQELADLFMEKTRFSVRFQAHSQGERVIVNDEERTLTREGQERLEFYMSPNMGEPEKALAKIASGGEISRIMLALKRILSNASDRTALIFDEVDTGVSGRVAQAIGEKIFAIAKEAQVLCISHLPQVAALASTHMHIAKHEERERVQTTVTTLQENDRVDELARMLSGAAVTAKTRENARELLEFATVR